MKKLLFSALVGAMVISCSRDNDNTNPTTPQTPATNETGILPVKYSYYDDRSNQLSAEITFIYNGTKLTKLIHNDGDVSNVSYNGNLITSIINSKMSSEFGYDSNGNLTSEKLKRFSNSTKTSENDITYTINGSTVTAQKISKDYDYRDGTLSSITTSTITYTLDTQKRPIKSVEVSETKDTTGNITFQENKTTTIQYANHHSPLKNIVGFDKLNYSDFTDHDDEAFTNTISYMKEESKVTQYHGGSNVVTNNVYETKHEYIINSNNYPIKEQEYYRSNSSGTYAKDRGQTIIEYNK